MLIRKWLLGTAVLGCALASQSADAATVYSNIASFPNSGVAGAATLVSGSTYRTAVIADDINPIAGFAGQAVTSVTYSIYNLDLAAAPTVTPTIYFYAADGAPYSLFSGSGNGPGTLLFSAVLSPVSQAANSVGLYTFSPINFVLPSGTFWAGIDFTGVGTAQTIGNIGQGVSSNPTIGTSGNLFFRGDTGGAAGTNNPAGMVTSIGRNPQANFGWQFTVADAVPEPATWAMMIAGFGLVGASLRRRRATVRVSFA